jgi:O-antigen ligase
MSAWLSQPGRPSGRGPAAAIADLTLVARRFDLRGALLLGGLICVLIAQGAALTQSYLWAAPLLCVLVVALATDIPLAPTVGVALLVRVLTSQAVSSRHSQYSTSLNLSAAIAGLFILLAVGLLIRRRRGVAVASTAMLFLCVSTLVAIGTHGESTLTIREGVREASIVAVPIIVLNARGAFTVSIAARLVQVAGLGAALLAIYQLATHTGLNVGGNIRADGTFTHPNGAAMYFAIAVTASLWRYLDCGRRRTDAILMAIYAVATIATFSLGGLASLLAMLIVFGAVRPGSLRLKLGSFAVGAAIVVAFAVSSVGAARIANESTTTVSSAQTRGAANTSLAWRLYKWQTLLPEWERAPLVGQGLGTTVTAEGTSENVTAGKVPHNEYVRYLVETGAVGLGILLFAAAHLMRRLARVRRVGGARSAGPLGTAVLAGCLFNALGDNTLIYSTTGYAAGLIVAAVLASSGGAVRRSAMREPATIEAA